MNSRVAAALAGLFGSELDADCVIMFCQERTGAPSGFSQPSDDVKCSTASSEAGVQNSELLADPFPGHLLILRKASELFNAQADRWRPLKAARTKGKTSAVAGRVHLRVVLGSREEVPAARAAIGFAYTGRVAAASVREALEVRRQGSYLQMDGCDAACTQAIRELLVSGSGANGGAAGGSGGDGRDALPPVLQLFCCEALWPDADEDGGFAALVAAYKSKLVSHFGNALATLNTSALKRQLLELSVAGLEALLEADDFGTDSESSVLLLLAEWMEANRARTDAPTRQRLCRHLRLVHLGRPYLTHILPALAAAHAIDPESPAGWLPVSVTEAAHICSYASASPVERKCMQEDIRVSDLASPTYTAGARRQCLPADGVTYIWQVTEQDLRNALGGMKPGEYRNMFPTFEGVGAHIVAHGFHWRVCLNAQGGQANGGVFMRCYLPPVYERLGSQLWVMVPVDAHVKANRWADGVPQVGIASTWESSTCFVRTGIGRGYPSALPLRAPAAGGGPSDTPSVASWSEYLHGGKISGTVTLRRPASAGV